jgi:hypothetical protein
MVGPRWIRICLALAATTLLATGCAAANGSALTVLTLNPNSINAGFQIEIRATCGDNLNPAFVSSRAFGSITLLADHGILTDVVTIPKTTAAGTYTVSLQCASGQRSSAELTVLNGHGKPNVHHGPDTGGGEMAASTGAKLALGGGLLAIVAGVGLWLVSMSRRRASMRG